MRLNKKSYLWNMFLTIFSLDMFLVLILCVLQTQDHLPTSKMILLPVIFVVVWSLIYFALYKIQNQLQKKSPVAMLFFLILYGLFLYVLAVSGRNEPVHDQKAVYQGALYFAGLSEEMPWEYFAKYGNNTVAALILGGLFWIGSLGGGDPYYFAVLINVVQVIIAMYCLYRLSESRNGVIGGWIAVLMLAGCIPVVGHTLALYTDSMSFCFGVLALYLWQFSKEEKRGARKCFLNILIGFLIGVAALVKMTALITIIALLVYSVFETNRKMILRSIAVLVVTLMVINAGNALTKRLPCESMRDSYGVPSISYFLGIGLKGNGGYIDNQEYPAALNTIYGMEAKKAWSNQYIRKNLYEFWNQDHIVQKLRYNFASGGMGCAIFVHNLNQEHLLHRMMHYEGDMYWRYSMLTTAYMYTFYGLVIIGMILVLVKKKEKDAVFGVPLIAIFGIMFYLMLFEANNRQLYNHLAWFVLAANSGLLEIWNTIRKK